MSMLLVEACRIAGRGPEAPAGRAAAAVSPSRPHVGRLVQLARLGGMAGLAAGLAAAVCWSTPAAAVGRTEPAAQMRENPVRGQELRRQLLEYHRLGRPDSSTRLAPQAPATVAPGLAPSIAPTIPPAAPPVAAPGLAPSIAPAIAPGMAPVIAPAATGAGPLLPGAPVTPLQDTLASPLANPVATPIGDAVPAGVVPVDKARLSVDERLLLRQQLRQLPRLRTTAPD